MKLVLLTATALGMLLTPSQPSGSGNGQIALTVINCETATAVAPVISVLKWHANERPLRPVTVIAHETLKGSGIYNASVDVHAGNYIASAVSGSCRTASSTPVAVFHSQVRHIILLTSRRCCSTPTLYNSAVALSIPDGITADLRSASAWNLPRVRFGLRDGSLTYFSSLAPDRYFLEMHLSQTTLCRGLTVPRTGSGYQQFIALNVSAIAPLLRQAAEAPHVGACG